MEWHTESNPTSARRVRQGIATVVVEMRIVQGCAFGTSLEPGDGTHYEVFGHYVRTDSAGQELWLVGFMAGYDCGRSARLPLNGELRADYVQEKLELRNSWSAYVLTDFLNYFTEYQAARASGKAEEEEHGRVWPDVEEEARGPETFRGPPSENLGEPCPRCGDNHKDPVDFGDPKRDDLMDEARAGAAEERREREGEDPGDDRQLREQPLEQIPDPLDREEAREYRRALAEEALDSKAGFTPEERDS